MQLPALCRSSDLQSQVVDPWPGFNRSHRQPRKAAGAGLAPRVNRRALRDESCKRKGMSQSDQRPRPPAAAFAWAHSAAQGTHGTDFHLKPETHDRANRGCLKFPHPFFLYYFGYLVPRKRMFEDILRTKVFSSSVIAVTGPTHRVHGCQTRYLEYYFFVSLSHVPESPSVLHAEMSRNTYDIGVRS